MLELLEGTANDLPCAQAVLEAVYPHHAGARAYHAARAPGADPLGRLWLAQLEEQSVGFAQVRTSSLHPRTDYVTVAVLPALWGQSIGTRLLYRLEEELGNRSRRQQTAFPESQTAARAFIEHHGFESVMQTYSVQVAAKSIALEPFVAAHTQALELGLTFSALLESPQLADEVALLQHRVYQASHGYNPVPDFTLEQMRELWLNEEMNPASLFLALREREPVGFAALYGAGQALELAYFGTDPEHAALEPWLSLALTGQALEFAAARGAVLEAEFDSLNPTAMAVLEALGVDPCEAWVTYQRTPQTFQPLERLH